VVVAEVVVEAKASLSELPMLKLVVVDLEADQHNAVNMVMPVVVEVVAKVAVEPPVMSMATKVKSQAVLHLMPQVLDLVLAQEPRDSSQLAGVAMVIQVKDLLVVVAAVVVAVLKQLALMMALLKVLAKVQAVAPVLELQTTGRREEKESKRTLNIPNILLVEVAVVVQVVPKYTLDL